MNKTKFFASCPKTRREFVAKFRNDNIFRNWAMVYGFAVIGDCVIFPDGRVADMNVRQPACLPARVNNSGR